MPAEQDKAMRFGLKAGTIDRINGVFLSHPEVHEVILYGSRAKGSYRLGSDIDLTMRGTGLDLRLMNRISLEIDDLLLPYSVDLSIFAHIDNKELLDHIERVGKIFYTRSDRC
ncbi:MAG TPA: nucleotidyltransferase domain-containing protein [Desulfomicrobiaceae bacterium]|nr:nucleotidyltransferase domain-containing protein [Desulfomicrobiaceae bacterium]